MATPASPSDRVMEWIDMRLRTAKGGNITIGHRDLQRLAKIVGIKGKHGWFSRHTVRREVLEKVQEIVAQWQDNHAEQIISRSKYRSDFSKKIRLLDRIKLTATEEGRLTVTLGDVSATAGKIAGIAKAQGLNPEMNISRQWRFHERLKFFSQNLGLNIDVLLNILRSKAPELLDRNKRLSRDYLIGKRDFLEHPLLKDLFSLSVIQEFLDGLKEESTAFYNSGEINPLALRETITGFIDKMQVMQGPIQTLSIFKERLNKLKEIQKEISTYSEEIEGQEFPGGKQLVWKKVTPFDELLKVRDYKFVKDLGQGASGSVALYRNAGTGKCIAVKQFHDNRALSIKALHKEIAAISLSSSRHIARPLFAIADREGNTTSVAFEYIEGVTLKAYELPDLEINTDIRMACQLQKGLRDLHGIGVIHTDLAAHNIMIDADTEDVKIIDFGLIYREGEMWRTLRKQVLSIQYPPELFQGSVASRKIDDWSFGLILSNIFVTKQSYKNVLGQIMLMRKYYPEFILFFAYKQLDNPPHLIEGEQPYLEQYLTHYHNQYNVSLGQYSELYAQLGVINEELKHSQDELRYRLQQSPLDSKQIAMLRVRIVELEQKLKKTKIAWRNFEKARFPVFVLLDTLESYLDALDKAKYSELSEARDSLRREIKDAREAIQENRTFTAPSLAALRAKIKETEQGLEEKVEAKKQLLQKFVHISDRPDKQWIEKHVRGFVDVDPTTRSSVEDLTKDPFFKIHETMHIALERAEELGISLREISDLFIRYNLFSEDFLGIHERFQLDHNILEDSDFRACIKAIHRLFLAKIREKGSKGFVLSDDYWKKFVRWCAISSTDIVNIDVLQVQFSNYLIIIKAFIDAKIPESQWDDRLKRVGLLKEGKLVLKDLSQGLNRRLVELDQTLTERGQTSPEELVSLVAAARGSVPTPQAVLSDRAISEGDMVLDELVQVDTPQIQLDRFINQLVSNMMPIAKVCNTSPLTSQELRTYLVELFQRAGIIDDFGVIQAPDFVIEKILQLRHPVFRDINTQIISLYIPDLARQWGLPPEVMYSSFDLLGYGEFRASEILLPLQEMAIRLNSFVPILDLLIAADISIKDFRTILTRANLLQDGRVKKDYDFSEGIKRVRRILREDAPPFIEE